MTTNHYTDFANAEQLAANYDAVISIGYINLDIKFRKARGKFLHLDFEDVDEDCVQNDPTFCEIGPSYKHITNLVYFIRKLKENEKLLIHCFSGYSRSSAAIMIALQERDKMTEDQAREIVSSLRVPDQCVCEPNKLMLQIYKSL